MAVNAQNENSQGIPLKTQWTHIKNISFTKPTMQPLKFDFCYNMIYIQST